MGASTSEILAALTLPGGDAERQVGSAEIRVSERWREFIRLYGDEADVARLVRGASLPIGGPAVITIGLETLLGFGGGGDDGGGGLVPPFSDSFAASYSSTVSGDRFLALPQPSVSRPNEAYVRWRITSASVVTGSTADQGILADQPCAFMTRSTEAIASVRLPPLTDWGAGNLGQFTRYGVDILTRPTPWRTIAQANNLWFSVPLRTRNDFSDLAILYTLEWT